MYQLLLTKRYLTSRVMPLLAALSVAMSTAMVLVIWSIMGGFLTEFIASSRTMLGDVMVERPSEGLRAYPDLLDRLNDTDDVDAATATLETLGLLVLPSGELRTVEVVGVEPDSYDAVTGYRDGLVWTTDNAMRDGAVLRTADDDARPMVVAGVSIASGPDTSRTIDLEPGDQITLTVLPLDERSGSATMTGIRYPVANLLRTGRHDIDTSRVLMPLDELQSLLGYSSGESVNRIGTMTRLERVSARATTIMVTGKSGVSADELLPSVHEAYGAFAVAHRGEVPTLDAMISSEFISTWDQRPWQRLFIAEVKKQIALLLGLFSFISLTASFLVFAVFWSMVSEKVRDIGVLRALGAARRGVLGLFLTYGAALGLSGALLGVLLAWIIVANINPIHDWLTHVLGFVLWDPDVYYFTRIPNRLDPIRSVLVVIGGVVLSLIGALLPALRAARLAPARALQFE